MTTFATLGLNNVVFWTGIFKKVKKVTESREESGSESDKSGSLCALRVRKCQKVTKGDGIGQKVQKVQKVTESRGLSTFNGGELVFWLVDSGLFRPGWRSCHPSFPSSPSRGLRKVRF